jgi:hypothetical protein
MLQFVSATSRSLRLESIMDRHRVLHKFAGAGLLEDSDDWSITGCLLEVAATSCQWLDSREHCHCYCCAEVEDGRLPFDYEPGCGFRPRVLL